jgi:hypothetical protein
LAKERELCGEFCKGRIVDKERGVYCRCIEALLPKPSRQSVKAISCDTIERYSAPKEPRCYTLNEFLRHLEKYGLAVYEVKLVYYRAVKKMPFDRIVPKLGWVSRSSASYHYRKALDKLRKAGFKFNLQNRGYV